MAQMTIFDELKARGLIAQMTNEEEIKELINSLHNGREKMVLYYHFLRGESVESSARLIGISRRTAYRMLDKGIAMVALALRERALRDCQNYDRVKSE